MKFEEQLKWRNKQIQTAQKHIREHPDRYGANRAIFARDRTKFEAQSQVPVSHFMPLTAPSKKGVPQRTLAHLAGSRENKRDWRPLIYDDAQLNNFMTSGRFNEKVRAQQQALMSEVWVG